ncbi:sucrose-6-phosphate hydrolase [Enterococcus sp. 669A]|uniref:Sucrose-6-phosphate hydrolase n=1 Tax=Candidatus Enterococcus moelleringii TaxID=2815325 RepID=A0ABS3L7W1_9ENTE|nr:sucrose-6-phosphate hydrolase [Enterococcus sp. 669A]MBO1305175.1 sucrose-6-phosphate hydrolase [Enterococcus sp. 669A]
MNTIKEWTDELRYTPYHQWDQQYQKQLIKTVRNSPWHLNYHIQPESGLLNDPNGFSYFNGKWYLFYQAYPMGAVHGVKSWYQLTSENLIDWQPEGFALLPDSSYDSHGVYSGSGIVVDDELVLAYTGNVRDENWQRQSYQMLAYMNQQGEITKSDQPFIPTPPKGYTHEFRDPQVFTYGGDYWVLIGAQRENLEGVVLAYAGESLEALEFKGELNFTDQSMGFMVECPNLVFIDGTPVLLFCPQGLDSKLNPYQNIYPNTYITADTFDTEQLALTNPSQLQNLDEGFDVYATQAFNAPDGRALAVSWIGLPEIEYPSDQEGWAHCLSIIKELKLKNGQLYQVPVAEQAELRQEEQALAGTLSPQAAPLLEETDNSYEIMLDLSADSQGKLHLFADKELNHSLVIDFDAKNGMIKVDRSNAGISFAEGYGTTRSFSIEKQQALNLRIFVDHSVCEIFINDGQKVATARVFPQEGETGLFIEGSNGTYSGSYWRLRKMKNK